MEELVAIFQRLRAHPLLSIILTSFTLVAAFYAGAIFAVGVQFLPIIDKLDLIVLLAFFGSLLGVAFRVFIALIDVSVRAMAMMGNGVGDIFNVDEARIVRWLSIVGALIPVFGLLTAVSTIATGKPFSVDLLAQLPWQSWLFFLGAPALYGATYLVPFLKAFRPAFLSLMIVFWILTAFLGGLQWIEYLRMYAPRTTVALSTGDPVRASIALPAVDGVIMFFEGSRDTHYVPWHQIKSIDVPFRQ